ncbi:serine protease FAM111A-like [Labrus mixtus]|uniref:serine protease FAM111A-like n=1 Tax=Labrus mixtus TaxID=508554 RepID=UPI0029C013B2|nr:serine protease FAM111A-like [Labrus mixtus]
MDTPRRKEDNKSLYRLIDQRETPYRAAQDYRGRNRLTRMDNRKTGGASTSQTGTSCKVKEEKGDDSTTQHDHGFSIQINRTDKRKHEINCKRPQTVLEAIKSRDIYKTLGWSDRNILIQYGRSDKEFLVATHFPCSCIEEGEVLIISKTSDQVEQEREVRPLLSKDDYVVFYIDTTGGKNTRTKTLFISNAVKKFKFLCVYGEKGITVEEALNRDGRFDNIAGFNLTNNDDSDMVIQSNDSIDNLQGRKFKIELSKEKGAKGSKNQGASDKTQRRSDSGAERHVVHQRGGTDRTPGPSNRPEQTPVSAAERHVVHQRGVRVIQECGSDVDREEIYQMLRQQYPDLKQLMESRFPGDSYERELKLRKENFGKIQNTFSKFHIVKKLIERGESVCKVVVENKCSGTGFVLFDNFIITNAHLFKNYVEDNTLKQGVNVYVIFNYDVPLPHIQYYYFKVEQSRIFYMEDELDYAVLLVQPDLTAQTEQGKHSPLPAGLLESIGEMPADGAACLIGHPGGDVKQIDLTSIIETEKREQAIRDHLKAEPSIVKYINETWGKGLEMIIKGGTKADKGMTYDTFMLHGASGSPLFDADGSVCGLHTSGFVYENSKHSVIEFAYSMEKIMKHFVNMLIHQKNTGLLERVKKAAGENTVLKKIFESVGEQLLMSIKGEQEVQGLQIDKVDEEEPMDSTPLADC